MVSHLRFNKEIPDAQELTPVPENIIALVCKYFKIDKEQVFASRRGKENLPRDIAIYLIRHQSRMTLTSIGKYFNISNYSTVSRAVERIKLRKKEDGIVQKHLKTIEKNIVKSQRET